MNNLQRLGNTFSISLKADGDGYLGRECPIKECLGYFKITPGTGIKGPLRVSAGAAFVRTAGSRAIWTSTPRRGNAATAERGSGTTNTTSADRSIQAIRSGALLRFCISEI